MKTTLVLPYGVTARNFLLGSLATYLMEIGTLSVIQPVGLSLKEALPDMPDGIEWIDARPFTEGKPGNLLRRTISLGHMRVGNTVGMKRMLNHYYRNLPGLFSLGGVGGRLAWWLSKLMTDHTLLRQWSARYVKLQSRRSAYREYVKMLQQLRPDVVMCGDQRPPEIAAIASAARACGIPVGTFIFSWDNLSSKGRMPCEFDFYCVWSSLMKRELLQFYPFIDPDAVYITGTPQFEPYFDERLFVSREEFCADVGADPNRPVICYAGEDVITDPENPEHLQVICDLIKNGSITGNPQVLVRPAPSDDGSRWADVRSKNPELIWSMPRWNRKPGAPWNKTVPTSEDVRLLTNIIRHSACCVNMVSTMTLDFAICGKPSVNIAFDVHEPPPHGMPVWDMLFQFEHYRPVVELGAAHIARSSFELAEKVNQAISKPDDNKNARIKFIRLQTDDTIASASRNILKVLTTAANR